MPHLPIDRHIPQFSGDRSARSADDHKRREQGPQFADHGHDDNAAHETARAQTRQLCPGLRDDRNTQQQGDDAGDGKSIDAREENLSLAMTWKDSRRPCRVGVTKSKKACADSVASEAR